MVIRPSPCTAEPVWLEPDLLADEDDVDAAG
jgi:hypothetical protein